MKELANYNDKHFTLNDMPFAKHYELRPVSDDLVSLVSVYDRSNELFTAEPIANVSIDGETFDIMKDLLTAFEPLAPNFNKAEAPAQNLILRRGFASYEGNPLGESHFEVSFGEPLTDYADAQLHVFITPRNAAAGSRAHYVGPISKATTLDVHFTGNITDEVQFDWMVVLGIVPEPEEE